ncbi:FecR domain-containing protein [Chitinophaga filiformis]|uniref:FecR family protein n=1 Tax=Chitinophaga filiformis TaxID=104663 RepID=UPI001F1979C9|nr:FecR domain-containing protein [Chitinophaga filiformis]MCF6405691.1 FecR domain-containing protein [Chitinophaga filiformis]
MKISSQLLEKYFKGLCTDEEVEIVEAYLDQEETPEAEAYFMQISELTEVASTNKETDKGPFLKRIVHPGYSIAAAVIVVLSVLAWLWQYPRQRRELKVAVLSDTIYNNSNTIRLVHMADGSRIWMNAYATIIYNKSYSISNRELWLNGEAYFEVGKQAEFPFKVHTSGITTTALGTAFNIATANKADGAIQVSLVEGRVAVSDTLKGASFRYVLEPGQMLEYRDGRQPDVPKAFNAKTTLGWKNYKIIFDHTTLADAFALLESRYKCRITLVDDKLAGKKISGNFNANQSVSSILETLGYVHKFTSTHQVNSNNYIIKKK